MKKSTEERFWEKVDKTDTCWNWTGSLDKGYGRFRTGESWPRAHRYSYELEVGPIPSGMQLDHLCHNRACVRVSRLRAVTHKQNAENLLRYSAWSTSGVRGVVRTARGKWQARVTHNGKFFSAGTHVELADAEAAVIAKRNELFTHNDLDRVA